MWGWREDDEGVAVMGVAVVEGDSGEGGFSGGCWCGGVYIGMRQEYVDEKGNDDGCGECHVALCGTSEVNRRLEEMDMGIRVDRHGE
ncbi:hypothetical protein Tco_0751956 [Tanacetum coccineum]|uniref:Uncharacterized protein n=1 Tax=Tanacetum coccineum TaxID=301880 RepID=A0ABQ4Z6G4_9ASTR